jgi:hypothetical protein
MSYEEYKEFYYAAGEQIATSIALHTNATLKQIREWLAMLHSIV